MLRSKTIKEAIKALLKSLASIFVVFTDEHTALILLEEVNGTNNMRKFVWIASNKWANSDIIGAGALQISWANSDLIRDKFPEIASGMYGFQLHNDHVKDFDEYFSQ